MGSLMGCYCEDGDGVGVRFVSVKVLEWWGRGSIEGISRCHSIDMLPKFICLICLVI